MGKSNPFGGTVDLGLLPQIPKGLQVLVARMEDIENLIFVAMEERERERESGSRRSSRRWKTTIYQGSRKIAIASHLP
jgi:hypothetical protein